VDAGGSELCCSLLSWRSPAFASSIEAGKQELHPADAIVVFGAAEYAGRPSPVLRARLDHAYDLYAKHLAPVIMTTGGAGGPELQRKAASATITSCAAAFPNAIS
jgi:hypothetical protein